MRIAQGVNDRFGVGPVTLAICSGQALLFHIDTGSDGNAHGYYAAVPTQAFYSLRECSLHFTLD